MQLLLNFLFGKPRQGYPLQPVTAKPPRQTSPISFEDWVREFKVGGLYNHEESHETCERLKVLKLRKGILSKELSEVHINPPKPISSEGRS